MGRIFIASLTFLSLLLSSCSTSTPHASPAPQVVSVYSTSSAQPWLAELYDCATKSSSIIRLSDSPSDADIRLQVGEPKYLSSFAYHIDEENIVVVMNNARPPVVNFRQIKGMFTGQITNFNQITSGWGNAHSGESGDVHVWVYSSDDDVQQIFNKVVLENRPVIFSAILASSPQNMLAAIQNDPSAIGFLPQHWNPNHEVFEQAIVATVPVLAITQSEPQGAINQLIGCLQK